jgi:caffeoyl-CoA O-methyltransferase
MWSPSRLGIVPAMDIVDPRIEAYMRGLLDRYDEPVLLEMEARGAELNFPIVGRAVGVTLEVLARSAGATRIIELGSGFGYSGYWHARAAGPGGEVHLTDGDPENERLAAGFLGRAGLGEQITFHVGDAVTTLRGLQGDFDLVYNDIDKEGYPEAWRQARERIAIGGLYVCDNVLWSGRVPADGEPEDPRTAPIREHNQMIATDERYVSTIVPTRDGVFVAVRIA